MINKISWFLIGVFFGWFIIGIMFPDVGKYIMTEGFLPQVIDTIKGWFVK